MSDFERLLRDDVHARRCWREVVTREIRRRSTASTLDTANRRSRALRSPRNFGLAFDESAAGRERAFEDVSHDALYEALSELTGTDPVAGERDLQTSKPFAAGAGLDPEDRCAVRPPVGDVGDVRRFSRRSASRTEILPAWAGSRAAGH